MVVTALKPVKERFYCSHVRGLGYRRDKGNTVASESLSLCGVLMRCGDGKDGEEV